MFSIRHTYNQVKKDQELIDKHTHVHAHVPQQRGVVDPQLRPCQIMVVLGQEETLTVDTISGFDIIFFYTKMIREDLSKVYYNLEKLIWEFTGKG